MIQCGKYTETNLAYDKRVTASITETVQSNTVSYLELDTHAVTSCVRINCRIVAYTEKTCEVTPYHPDYHPIRDIPIVQAAAAYTCPETGQTYILIINQSLYMRESLSVSYLNDLNPIQVRHNGVIVDNIPKHLAPDPEKATHSLYFPQHNLQIPLQWKGVISWLLKPQSND
jgi:hypothetical protein